MVQVIKVSKTGKNVLTETDKNNFIFDSRYNTLKIIATGTVSGTISAGSTDTITIAHNKSYTPLITAFAKQRGGSVVMSTSQFKLGAFNTFKFLSSSSDGTNLHFEIKNTDISASGTFDVRYYIFEVPL